MKKWLILMILLCLPQFASADSVLGSFDLYESRREIPIINQVKSKGVLDQDSINFLENNDASLEDKIALLNVVAQGKTTLLNTSILAKHWNTTYENVFNAQVSLSDEKLFLLVVSALFEDSFNASKHQEVLNRLKSSFRDNPIFLIIYEFAIVQADLMNDIDYEQTHYNLIAKLKRISIKYNYDNWFLQACMRHVASFIEKSVENIQPFYPRYANGRNLPTQDEITQLLKEEISQDDQQVGQLELTCNEDNRIGVNSCEQFFSLLEKGCYAYSNADMGIQSHFIKRCEPLNDYKNVGFSNQSFVDDFLDQSPEEIISSLPMNFSPMLSGDEEEEYKLASQKGIHWSDMLYDLEIEKNDDFSFQYVSDAANTQKYFDVLAFGDINEDGFEDMLVFVSNYLTRGTMRYYGTYWLTRTKSDQSILEVINLDGK